MNNQAKGKVKGMTQSEGTPSTQELVLVASVRVSVAKSAEAALNRAQIDFTGSVGRGVEGLYVSKSDLARAKTVLKDDAQAHQYKIDIAD